MNILNRKQIIALLEEDKSSLQITNFDERYLQHSFYYFRLDPESINNKTSVINQTTSHFTLEANQSIEIESFEIFKFGSRIIGFLGQDSELALKDILLLHGLSIDPMYHGKLKMKMKNLAVKDRSISKNEIIGKIYFIIVDESFELQKDSIISQKYGKRLPAPYTDGDDPARYSQAILENRGEE